MATIYPYISGQGALVKAFEQFRKSFPVALDAEWLQKFSIAPANESYLISTVRFLGLIDEDGKRIDAHTDFFYGDDTTFAAGLDARVTEAYKPLFDDHGPAAWGESKDQLATWFRVTDKVSELVGGRQASTFLTLAALAGHGEVRRSTSNGNGSAKPATQVQKRVSKRPSKEPVTTADSETVAVQNGGTANGVSSSNVGLSVRIEVNLPSNGTPDTYDAIFASVRKHLIDRG